MVAAQTWYLLKLTIDAEYSDAASSFLFDLSANGIQEEDRNAHTVLLHAYFNPTETNVAALKERVNHAFPTAEVTMEPVTWDPADESWRQYFSPFEIVPRVVVAPTWEQFSPRPEQRLITMDPGMAFGTGLHPTTRMCAHAIYDLCRLDQPPTSLLDVGCGSGLLGLVAHRLGIREIQAVEIDPDALRVAHENFVLNSVPDIVLHENIAAVRDDFSLVVANILFNTLIELRDELVRVTASGGYLVLSGITEGQLDELTAAYAEHTSVEKNYRDGEWQCVVLKR